MSGPPILSAWIAPYWPVSYIAQMKTAIALVIALFACSTASAYENLYPHVEQDPDPAPLTGPMTTKADIPKARAAVRHVLRDPMSALFQGEFFQRGVVCGQVNSKNRMGGYEGNIVYAYVVSTGEVLLLEGPASVEKANIENKLTVFCHI